MFQNTWLQPYLEELYYG